MLKKVILAAALCLAATPALAQGGMNPLEELKKILQQMKVAEKMLARLSLEKGSEAEKRAIEEIEKLEKKLGVKPDPKAEKAADRMKDAERRLKRLMDEVNKRQGDIIRGFDKIIQSLKVSQSSGSGSQQLDMKNKSKGKKKKKGGQRKEGGDKLKKTGNQDKKGSSGGKTEANSKGGPADKAYDAKRPGDPVNPPRKTGGQGRWGNLPKKLFKQLISPETNPRPQKYSELMDKYFEMLSKLAGKD